MQCKQFSRAAAQACSGGRQPTESSVSKRCQPRSGGGVNQLRDIALQAVCDSSSATRTQVPVLCRTVDQVPSGFDGRSTSQRCARRDPTYAVETALSAKSDRRDMRSPLHAAQRAAHDLDRSPRSHFRASNTKCPISGTMSFSIASCTAAIEPGMVRMTTRSRTPPTARLSMAAGPIWS